MRIGVTGGRGFLGWHLRVRLRARCAIDAVCLGRPDLADAESLAAAIKDLDVVVHLAGVNRARLDDDVEQGNVALAKTLSSAIRANGAPIHVVYGNTVQTRGDNPYGRGKRKAGQVLEEGVRQVDGTFTDVLLPNLYGEHGRPHYNSFVATFCHEIASGRRPSITGDREIPLLHAQAAAEIMIDAMKRDEKVVVLEPRGEPHHVSEVFRRLSDFHAKYKLGQIPALPDKFSVNLFNTYRSYMFPAHFPVQAQVNTDERGDLFETVRAHGGTGHSFISTTRPGMTRGEHYHLQKFERFFVVSGIGEVALRRVLDDQVIRFRLDGRKPSFVDMPTLWAHNITNVGDKDLVTMFWADQLLDPTAPDTYPESVG